MSKRKYNEKTLRDVTFNVDVVATKSEDLFVDICKGYAKYKGVKEANIIKDYYLLVPNKLIKTKKVKEPKGSIEK